LQAEPWCQQSIINASLYEQMTTLDLNQFYKNVEFAKKQELTLSISGELNGGIG